MSALSDPGAEVTDMKELADELQKTNEVLLSVAKVLEERKENDVLSEIKSECKKVANELFGTTGDQNPMGVLENTTIREVLDKIALQLNLFVSKGLNGANFTAENGIPNKQFRKYECTGVEIRSKTDTEEQCHLQKRFDDVLLCLAEGTELMLIDEGLYLTSSDASVFTGYSLRVTIENYLDVDMTELKKTWDTRSTLDMPQFIRARTGKILKMSNKMTSQVGIFSYLFRTYNLRLVVSLQEGSLAVGLGPADIPMGNNIFNFDSLNGSWTNNWATMSDKRWVKGNSNPQQFPIWNGNIHANVEFKGGRNSTVKIQIAKVCMDPSGDSGRVQRPLSSENIEDGETVLGKTIQGILEYHLETCGVVMEICNLLQVSLNDVSCYLENGKAPLALPQFFPSLSREVMMIKFDCTADQQGLGAGITSPEGLETRSFLAPRVFGTNFSSTTETPSCSPLQLSCSNASAPPVPILMSRAPYPVPWKPEMKGATPESIFLSHKTKLLPGYSGTQRSGLMLFRIGSTDLRLAVAFQLFYHGNRFAAAFVPANALANASTMSFLTNDNHWKTSPDLKYAYARDGEQVVQSRNIRASVQMTEGFKAVINVAIKAI